VSLVPPALVALACSACLAIALSACSTMGELSVEGVEARTRLREAIAAGEVDRVSAAARHADQWRGKEAQLDRLLGHALANVLMRPDQGLPLLEGNPADGNEEWAGWLAGAALRAGDYATMERIRRGLRLPNIDLVHPVVEQLTARARLDPRVGWGDMERAIAACDLLDGQPRRGRMPIEHDAPGVLPATALALGATDIVIGRAERLDDHDPLQGTGDIKCRTGRLVGGDRLPQPMPRNVTVGATDGTHRLYVNVKPVNGQNIAYAASDSVAVERWLEAAETLDGIPAGPGWPGVDDLPVLHRRFGVGLVKED
jgi:hypothetical protein